MNSLKFLWALALLAAAVAGNSNQRQQSQSGSWKPSEWLTPEELKQTPSLEEISFQNLENMSVDEAYQLLETIYHVSQIDNALEPTYVPAAANIPVDIIRLDGDKVSTTLDQLASTAKQQPSFGTDEVTIFITGLPDFSETVRKPNHELVAAYKQLYKFQSESQEKDGGSASQTKGSLVVIDLGKKLNNFKRYALLDVDETGAMIGDQLVKLTDQTKTQPGNINVVAQNVGAHVAGAAGREFKRQTGNRIATIIALDPSKLYAQNSETLSGLARGDAAYVEAIHGSVMGTTSRVGDADFYPNGPSKSMPGASNVIEASMRITQIQAELIRPGNGRNFPAVEANSFPDYVANNGYGKRAYMGNEANSDVKGDYMLQVNEQKPFGQRAPAQKQNSYHAIHKSTAWQ